MMRMLRLISFLMLTTLLAGCRKDTASERGVGNLHVSMRSFTAAFESRAASDAQEGLAFHNLLVVLTDDHGQVVDRVYKEYPYEPVPGDLQREAGYWPAEDVVFFQNLEVGTYHAYAYANIDHGEWQDGLVSDVEQRLRRAKSDGVSDALDQDRELRLLSGQEAPAALADEMPMLLTGQVTVPVGVAVNEVSIDLLRPVVRFNVYLNNHTPFDVRLDELDFSKFNASRTFLVPRDPVNGSPAVPPGTEYRKLPAYDTSAPFTVPPAAEGDEASGKMLVYSTLLYENASAEPYRMKAAVTLRKSDSGAEDLQARMGMVKMKSLTYQDLFGMGRGADASLKVMLSNPQINPRYGRIFAGTSGGNLLWESAGYNSYADYLDRAEAVWSESASYHYFDHISNTSYADYTGRNASGPFMDRTMDYTGKRDLFFRELVRTGDNAFSLADTFTDLAVEEGHYISGKMPEDTEGHLLRFKRNTDGKYLRATANNPDKTNFVYESGGTTQDRQFTLFCQYDPGSEMMVIEKGTNRGVPLMRMFRNQEYNVVMNVYYVEFETQFDFRVENTWWTEEGGHTSEHWFK